MNEHEALADFVAKHGPLTPEQEARTKLWMEARKGGVGWAVAIVRMNELDRLERWATETPDGARFVTALAWWHSLVSAGKRPLCLTCDHVFEAGGPPMGAFVTVWPVGGEGSGMLGVCQECSQKLGNKEIEAAVIKGGMELGIMNGERLS